MKYVLVAQQPLRPRRRRSEERRAEVCGQIFQWFETHLGLRRRRRRAPGPETATTVRSGEQGPRRRRRRPYSEAKEAIGRFSVIDVENLDAALELARSWPSLGLPGIAVEVRPIVEHRMD